MSVSPLTVLYVDPVEDRWDDVTGVLERRDKVESLAVDGFDSARTALEAWQVDCVVSEFDLGKATALDLFEWASDEAPDTGCILFSEVDPVTEVGDDAFEDLLAEYLPRNGTASTQRLADLVRSVGANSVGVGYPVPNDETDRLSTVRSYDLPNLSTIETFDRLTHLVASHFDIAVSFIGLVEEEEEQMIACHGADWQVLARDESICAYSMLEKDVTVVENVQADPRFEDNQTLRDLDIRSYAGANLTTPDGDVIGELCLIHDEPRGYDDEELVDLQMFADEAMEQLELRRRLSEQATA